MRRALCLVVTALLLSLAAGIGSAGSMGVDGGTIQTFTIPVSVDGPTTMLVTVAPQTFVLTPEGEDVTATLQPPLVGVPIELSAARLCLGIAACAEGGVAAASLDANESVPSLQVWFARADVLAMLAGVQPPPEGMDVMLVVSAVVNGQLFAGSGNIKVVAPQPPPGESTEETLSSMPTE
jgi:hypothetical protein